MKKISISIFLFAFLFFILSGCASQSEHTHSTICWAYPFVKVNGISYEASRNDKEISKSYVGKKIGVVKRNVENLDAGPDKYIEKDFDSNFLNKGTSLYENIKDKKVIIYEKNGKYYLAIKVKN